MSYIHLVVVVAGFIGTFFPAFGYWNSGQILAAFYIAMIGAVITAGSLHIVDSVLQNSEDKNMKTGEE